MNKRPGSARSGGFGGYGGQNKYKIPFLKQVSGVDVYREMRRILLNIVVDQNLYDRDIIMGDLCMQAKKINPHL